MNFGRTVFSQLIEFLPHQEFQKCVARYGAGRYLKNLSCWDQYLAMAFAQLTYRESLRDIEACLRSVGGKLYHMEFRGKVARSTLADANESRDWRIYADLCAGSHRAQASWVRVLTFPTSTDFQRYDFRESAHFTADRSIQLSIGVTR